MTVRITIAAQTGAADIELCMVGGDFGDPGSHGKVAPGETMERWVAGDGEALRITAIGGEVLVTVASAGDAELSLADGAGEVVESFAVPDEETAERTLSSDGPAVSVVIT